VLYGVIHRQSIGTTQFFLAAKCVLHVRHDYNFRRPPVTEHAPTYVQYVE
jgi:hypothetical protein